MPRNRDAHITKQKAERRKIALRRDALDLWILGLAAEGLTQAEIAERSGMSQSHVSDLIRAAAGED